MQGDKSLLIDFSLGLHRAGVMYWRNTQSRTLYITSPDVNTALYFLLVSNFFNLL